MATKAKGYTYMVHTIRYILQTNLNGLFSHNWPHDIVRYVPKVSFLLDAFTYTCTCICFHGVVTASVRLQPMRRWGRPLTNSVLIAKVDADSERDLGSRYGVRGFPTLKFFPKGSTEPEE